jgi:hypothetical protein
MWGKTVSIHSVLWGKLQCFSHPIYAWFCFSFYPSTYFLNYLVFQAIFHWFCTELWFFIGLFIWKFLSFLMGFCFDELLIHFRNKNALNLRRREGKETSKLNLYMPILKKKTCIFTAEKRQTCEFFLVLLIFFQLSWLFIWVDGYVILHVWHRDYYLYSNTTLGPASLTLHCQIQLTVWLPQSG